MEDEKRLVAEGIAAGPSDPRNDRIREVGGLLVYETARLRLVFSPEKKQSLAGTLRLENPATKRFYVDRFNLAQGPRRKAFVKEAVAKVELGFGEIETFLDQFVEQLTAADSKGGL